MPELEVSATLSPSQKVIVPLAEIVAVGNGFTVTFVREEVEVPHELVTKLRDLGFHLDKEWDRYNPMIRDVQKRFRLGRTPVDVLLNRDEHDVAAFSRRKKKKFDGRYVWFPSAEDLLLQKLKTGRPQDFIDAAGVVERMRGKLDLAYVTKWANKLGVRAELAYILSGGMV